MYGGTGSFNVGDLLRLFCLNLKDQIKHRMYFYKNSTLVRYVQYVHMYIPLPPCIVVMC